VNKPRKLGCWLSSPGRRAIGFFALRTREPAYEGKRLSGWLEEFNRSGRVKSTRKLRTQFARSEPTRCHSWWQIFVAEDSPRKLALMEWYNKWSSRKIPFKTFADRRGTALTAFYCVGNAGKLGPAAKPFLPSLGKLLDRQPEKAAFALLYIGAESTPYLTNALSHTNWLVRTWAAVALAKTQFGSSETRAGFWFDAQFVQLPTSFGRFFLFLLTTFQPSLPISKAPMLSCAPLLLKQPSNSKTPRGIADWFRRCCRSPGQRHSSSYAASQALKRIGSRNGSESRREMKRGRAIALVVCWLPASPSRRSLLPARVSRSIKGKRLNEWLHELDKLTFTKSPSTGHRSRAAHWN